MGFSPSIIFKYKGGVHERFRILKNSKTIRSLSDDGTVLMGKNNLWHLLDKSFNLKSLCGASIASKSTELNGLESDHAYSVIDRFQLKRPNPNFEILKNLNSIDHTIKLISMKKFHQFKKKKGLKMI